VAVILTLSTHKEQRAVVKKTACNFLAFII
jgi:hypothetical protein